MHNFIFCRDGILRIREWLPPRNGSEGLKVLLPLKVVEEKSIKNLFLKNISSGVELEEGLTVKELFLNLAPWADLLEGLASMDFHAFLEEVQKPNTTPSDNPIVKCIIRHYASLKTVPDFEDSKLTDRFEKKKNGFYEWKSPTPIVTNRWSFEYSSGVTGLTKEPVYDESSNSYISEYSISYTPMNEIADAIIEIDPNVFISDDFRFNQPYTDYRGSVFNTDHPAIEPVMWTPHGKTEPEVVNYKLKLDDDYFNPFMSFYQTIIRGFLWDIGFHYSPTQRSSELDVLNDRVSDIKIDENGEHYCDPIDEEVLDAEKLRKKELPTNGELLFAAVLENNANLIKYEGDKNDR